MILSEKNSFEKQVIRTGSVEMLKQVENQQK